jgi:hypothetical protein
MIFKVLADITVLIHFFWILFLIFGAFLGVRIWLLRIFHISGLAFALILQISGWYCPLTHLEVWLRSKHDPSLSYRSSFIVYYLEKTIYLEISPSSIFLATVFLVGFNLWLYLRKRK